MTEPNRFDAFDVLIAPLGKLPVRAANILSNMWACGAFDSLEALQKLGWRNLTRWKNCGRQTALVIADAMKRAGFLMLDAPVVSYCRCCGARLSNVTGKAARP